MSIEESNQVDQYPKGENMNEKMDEKISSISDNSERYQKAWETLQYAFDKIDDNRVFLGITAVKYIPSKLELRDEEKELLNEYLLKSLNIEYDFKDKILTLAQKFDQTITLVKALITAGANPKESKDDDGNNVIHRLCNNIVFIYFPDLFCKLLEILVVDGADINATNQDGETPIVVLFERINNFPTKDPKHTIATCLKKHGADPNAKYLDAKSFNEKLNYKVIDDKDPDHQYFTHLHKIMNKTSWFSLPNFTKGGKKTRFKKNKLRRKQRTRKGKGPRKTVGFL